MKFSIETTDDGWNETLVINDKHYQVTYSNGKRQTKSFSEQLEQEGYLDDIVYRVKSIIDESVLPYNFKNIIQDPKNVMKSRAEF